ncbi:cytochrome b/b6 domain-containing protein [Planctomycetota bacterium]
MKNDRIQRFTLTEVVLHWLHAVLYLVLAITGMTMLLGRLFEVQIASHRTLSVVHRIAGALLVFVLAQTFLLSLFARMFRQFWLTLHQCLSWHRADILWLLKVPLNMFSGRVSLPPVGRFNPGQKLHILIVFVVLIGFCFSGLAIMLIPGALGPWIIHLACFVPAALFLLLHLFLALINPETRKALPGIITGFISRDYAKEHHALMLDKVDGGNKKPYVSWRAALIFLFVMGILFSAAVWRHGFSRFAGNMGNLVARRGANLIMPGDLCASHSEEPQTRQCTTCHSAFGRISSEACLECHENISQIAANRVGYHGTLSGPCRNCHTEHFGKDSDIRQLDTAAFNHNLARFWLDGKHREVPCDKCHLRNGSGGMHQRTRYIGLDFTACSDCHSNPHKEAQAADCTECHTLGGWKEPNLLFVHNRDSKFRLEGKHSDTPCEKCHVPQPDSDESQKFVLYDIGTGCVECHRDPHNDQFKKGCETCHSEQGWTGRWLVDAHGSNSSFPLKGKHNSVACVECHRVTEGAKLAESRFAGLGKTCEQCHTDPHAGQFVRDCQTCHSEEGWKGRWLLDAHDPLSPYPLRGKHATVDCLKCHTPPEPEATLAEARFAGLSQKCESCHDDPHSGQMRSSCDTCHAEHGWTGQSLLFAHNQHSEFKLDRIHDDVLCASCHMGADTPLYQPLPKTCEQCHVNIVMQQLAEGYPAMGEPDPHAGRVSCVQCHSPDLQHQTPTGYADACRTCHNRHYEELFFNWMKSLNSRESQARLAVEHLRDQNTPKAEALVQKINRAKSVGFHNLALALKLWAEITADDSADDVQNKLGSPGMEDK